MNNSAEATLNTAPVEDSPVGYKQPPKKYKFKKGQSRIPKGRPKKAPNEPLFEEQVKRTLLDEAFRFVVVREGDSTVQKPTIQALIRTMLVKGLQGNAKLLCKAIEWLTQIEGERRAELLNDLENALGYKDFAHREREKCTAEGKPAPQYFIDPDAIELDLAQGAIRVRDPDTREANGRHRRLTEAKKKRETDLVELKAMLKEAPYDPVLLDDIAFTKKVLKKFEAAGV